MRAADVPVPESDILASCLAYLEWRRARPIRINSGMMKIPDESRAAGARFVAFNHTKGVSDVVACLRCGHFLAVEVKSKRGRLTNEQADFLADVSSRNGVSCCVRSVDDLRDVLEEHERGCPFLAAQRAEKSLAFGRTGGDLAHAELRRALKDGRQR